jgi:hypothetical protein
VKNDFIIDFQSINLILYNHTIAPNMDCIDVQ